MRHSQRVSFGIPHVRTGITLLACVFLFFGGCLIQAADEGGQFAPSNRVKLHFLTFV